MAKQEISGINVLNYISEDDGATWKVIVCETESTITGTNTTSTTQTKCGPKSSTSNEPATVTGSGVAQANEDANEMSYKRLSQLRYDKTPILFRRTNSAVPANSVAAGDVSFAEFPALVTEATETSNSTDATQFNWAVVSTGDIDYDGSGS